MTPGRTPWPVWLEQLLDPTQPLGCPWAIALLPSPCSPDGSVDRESPSQSRPITFNDIMEDELSAGGGKHMINTPPPPPPQRALSISVIETPPAPQGHAAADPPAVAFEAAMPPEAIGRGESYETADRIYRASV